MASMQSEKPEDNIMACRRCPLSSALLDYCGGGVNLVGEISEGQNTTYPALRSTVNQTFGRQGLPCIPIYRPDPFSGQFRILIDNNKL